MRVDRMRQELELKKKSKEDIKNETLNNFNQATLILINDFIKKVTNGTIELKDPNEFQRIFAMYMQLNELDSNNSGGGSLPELAVKQKEMLDSTLSIEQDDSGEAIVDEQALLDMTESDINELISNMDKEQNQQNYEKM